MYPFYYFPKLTIQTKEIKEFIESVPEYYWRGMGFQEYLTKDINPIRDPDWKAWTLLLKDYDILQCNAIRDLTKDLKIGNTPVWFDINIKRSKIDFQSEWRPLMQHPSIDGHIDRTYDIIVPIQGGFIESPLEAYDTVNKEYHTLVPKGQAFMVPTSTDWHYRWKETVYNFRYTVHIRGKKPFTYELMKQLA